MSPVSHPAIPDDVRKALEEPRERGSGAGDPRVKIPDVELVCPCCAGRGVKAARVLVRQPACGRWYRAKYVEDWYAQAPCLLCDKRGTVVLLEEATVDVLERVIEQLSKSEYELVTLDAGEGRLVSVPRKKLLSTLTAGLQRARAKEVLFPPTDVRGEPFPPARAVVHVDGQAYGGAMKYEKPTVESRVLTPSLVEELKTTGEPDALEPPAAERVVELVGSGKVVSKLALLARENARLSERVRELEAEVVRVAGESR